jgi:tRNA threonylcarbamoyladenosine biosynthesis protein TsaE
MERLVHEVNDEGGTERFGATLSELLPPGTVVALCGTLGAGKTRLVQAIAAAAGVDRRDVISPTFVLIHEYQGRRPIYHFDAYRLRDEDEFLQLGPEEYFDSAGLTIIEWADRIENALPADRVEVRIEVTGATTRRFELTATGSRCRGLITAIRDRLEAKPESP